MPRPEARGLHLDNIEDVTLGSKAGGYQPAAAPGAAIDRDDELALDDTALLAIDAPDDPSEDIERGGEREYVVATPP